MEKIITVYIAYLKVVTFPNLLQFCIQYFLYTAINAVQVNFTSGCTIILFSNILQRHSSNLLLRYITQIICFEKKNSFLIFWETVEMLFNHRKLCKVFFSDSVVKWNMKEDLVLWSSSSSLPSTGDNAANISKAPLK
jgi:hypothetical protein